MRAASSARSILCRAATQFLIVSPPLRVSASRSACNPRSCVSDQLDYLARLSGTIMKTSLISKIKGARISRGQIRTAERRFSTEFFGE